MAKSVLFVCTGNTCRSPAAAVLFGRRLVDPDEWWVESAGIRAARGALVSAEVLRLLAQRGLDLSHQRSKPLEDLPVEQFDLILVMEREQQRAVQARYPALAARVCLLAEMSGGDADLEDPYGGSAAAYERMLADLDNLLNQGLGAILERAGAAKT
jgi:protein-tyrosine-phosphatase